MTPKPITIKYLQGVIKSLAESHPWVKAVVIGEQYDFDENVTAFPCLWMIPNAYQPQPDRKITEFSFLVTTLDRVGDELEGETDVLSSCATALEDLYNSLQKTTQTGQTHAGEMWRVTRMEGRQKIVDNISDHVASGWMCELFFEAPFNLGTCDIPS